MRTRFVAPRAHMSSPVDSTISPFSSASLPREPVFHVRDLTRIYGDGTAGVTALAGVDFDLFAGELIVLLGASGSGKSTLLNQLGGLDSPTGGRLLYRGANLAEFNEAELTQY